MTKDFDQRKAVEHELEENKRQLGAHLAKPVPTEENDLRYWLAEKARLELVIDVYQQALGEM